MWRTLEITSHGYNPGRRGGTLQGRKERLTRVVRTTKTVRGKRYKTYYVKIDLPERIAERVKAYRVIIEEETGRITLEPVYSGEEGGEES